MLRNLMHDYGSGFKRFPKQVKARCDLPEPRMLLMSPADGEPFPPRRASRYAATTFMVEDDSHV